MIFACVIDGVEREFCNPTINVRRSDWVKLTPEEFNRLPVEQMHVKRMTTTTNGDILYITFSFPRTELSARFPDVNVVNFDGLWFIGAIFVARAFSNIVWVIKISKIHEKTRV